MIRVWIHGSSGKMGVAIRQAISEADKRTWDFVGGSDSKSNQASLRSGVGQADLILDFSSPAGSNALLGAVNNTQNKSVVLGSTGHSAEQLASWSAWAKFGNRVLFAPNTSVGVLVVRHILKQVAPVLIPRGFDCEIVESHHRDKRDAPSGTALTLAGVVEKSSILQKKFGRSGKRERNEVGISSLRGGSVIGEHEVQFLGDLEEIRISHRALDRRLFASGALTLGQWLSRQSTGSFELDDIEISDLT